MQLADNWSRGRKHWQRIVAVLLTMSLMATSACTSLRVLPLPAGPAQPPTVKIGEHVRVTTRSGDQKEFEVTGVDADALLGPGIRLSYQDIAMLEVRRIDKGRTAGIVAIIVGAVLIVVAAQVSSGYSELLNYD